MSDKFLVNCTYGYNDPERATVAFILAFTCSKTNETAVFITSDATELFLKDERREVQAIGYEPLYDLIDGFIANGGKVWICPACCRAKGVEADDLMPGVEIAGAPKTMAYLAGGAKTLV